MKFIISCFRDSHPTKWVSLENRDPVSERMSWRAGKADASGHVVARRVQSVLVQGLCGPCRATARRQTWVPTPRNPSPHCAVGHACAYSRERLREKSVGIQTLSCSSLSIFIQPCNLHPFLNPSILFLVHLFHCDLPHTATRLP